MAYFAYQPAPRGPVGQGESPAQHVDRARVFASARCEEHEGPRHDPSPYVRSAGGYVRGGNGRYADDCARRVLQPEVFEPQPSTPEHDKRFRRGDRGADIAGHDMRHFGDMKHFADIAVIASMKHFGEDQMDTPEKQPQPHWSGHGRPSGAVVRSGWSGKEENVGSLVQAKLDWGTAQVLQERKEVIYESNKREPLGKAHIR